MKQSSLDRPDKGNPTASEIFRVFQNTIMASIEGLRLLLVECADLRGELVTIHGLARDGVGQVSFSDHQRRRILELQEAAKGMEALLVSLPGRTASGSEN